MRLREDPTTPERRWARLDGVDALRGLAILLVLLNHVHMRLFLGKVAYADGLPRGLVSSLVWNGQCGVQIFFAVSGFLITSNALKRWGALPEVGVRDFYRLRVARIAPLLLLLLSVLCALHFAHLKDFSVSPKTGGLGRALLAALTFHVNVLEATRGYLPGSWDILWSLSVEEMFYLAFPLVCWLVGARRVFIAILLAFVVLGPFARTHGNEVWREYSYLGSMDAIALGCLTALAISRVSLSRRGYRAVGGIGAVLLCLCLGSSIHGRFEGLEEAGLKMTVIALGTCAVIVAAARAEWRSPSLFKPMLALGRRSYEVYLTHMFVVFAFFHLFLFAGKPISAVPALFVAVIVVSALLGAAVARLYSEPMNRLLRARWMSGEPR